MTPISIAPQFAEFGIAITLTCIEARVVVRESSAELRARLAAKAEEVAGALTASAVAELDEVAAARRAYRALGKDPTRYRVSSEALMRRLAQGKGIYHINNVVDVNNLVSLHATCAVGTYRLDALRPPIEFRPGRAGESYRAIARGELNLAHLPLFADASGPFGSPTSDSERSMITSDTTRILMVVIDFTGEEPACLELAVAALETHCGGDAIETDIVRST